MKRHIIISWFACVFGLSIFANAQATPTASRPGTLQLGGGYSITKPDYAGARIQGPSFYATYDFTSHLGVEFDLHYTSIVVPNDVGEDTYMVGPRYVIKHKRFEPYAKALFGGGTLNLQFDYLPHSKTTHFAYALGGGLDYHATRHLNVRCFDAEYQKWEFSPHGLTPFVMTFGAAYTFN